MRWIVLAIIVLAGCADKAPTLDCEETPEADACIVDDETGAIRGVVVDQAIVPLPEVDIYIAAVNSTTQSDEQGAWLLPDLDPGTYDVRFSKAGYTPTSHTINVEAGAVTPVVRVQLAAIEGYAPFNELITWDGFIQCNTTYVNACLIINYYPQALLGLDPLLQDTSVHVWWDEFVGKERHPDHVQIETLWDATQALGSALNIRYEVGTPDDVFIPCVFGSQEGQSPQVYKINRSMAEDAGLGAPDPHGGEDDYGSCDEEEAWGLAMEFFSGDALGVCQPTPIGCHPRVGVTVEQYVSTYITSFYDYVPPEAWNFYEGSEIPPP